MFDVIAFDGDDTLWHNESLYQMGRRRFETLLAKHGVTEIDEARVDEIEIRNLPYYGYGAMSFVLSLIEAAIELTGGAITSTDIQGLLVLGKEMLSADVELFEGVAETLRTMAQERELVLITKGDLQHQQSKVANSGIQGFFKQVEIVSDKTPAVYQGILERLGVPAERFLMVGNSMRSDILPVLALGGWAVHVPHHLTWSHEAVEPPDGPLERFYELERLAELPALLERLESQGNRN
jgi:putative hydrolase of the HAD superfamily